MADVDTGSLDKSNAPPTGLPVLLEEARRELRDDIVLGHGGRTALARFAERFDGLLRHILDAAPRTEPVAPVSIVALGGYGRRQLCLHSDIDLLVLFDGPIGAAEEATLPRRSCTRSGIWRSSSATRSASSTTSPARDRQSRVPAGAARRAAGRRRPRAATTASRPRSTTPARTRSILERAEDAHRRAARAVQRHALSARAGHQGRARRAARSAGGAHDRRADRPGAARARSGRSRAPRRGRGFPAAHPVDPAPRDASATRTMLSHELQEKPARHRSATRARRSSASSG